MEKYKTFKELNFGDDVYCSFDNKFVIGKFAGIEKAKYENHLYKIVVNIDGVIYQTMNIEEIFLFNSYCVVFSTDENKARGGYRGYTTIDELKEDTLGTIDTHQKCIDVCKETLKQIEKYETGECR